MSTLILRVNKFICALSQCRNSVSSPSYRHHKCVRDDVSYIGPRIQQHRYSTQFHEFLSHRDRIFLTQTIIHILICRLNSIRIPRINIRKLFHLAVGHLEILPLILEFLLPGFIHAVNLTDQITHGRLRIIIQHRDCCCLGELSGFCQSLTHVSYNLHSFIHSSCIGQFFCDIISQRNRRGILFGSIDHLSELNNGRINVTAGKNSISFCFGIRIAQLRIHIRIGNKFIFQRLRCIGLIDKCVIVTPHTLISGLICVLLHLHVVLFNALLYILYRSRIALLIHICRALLCRIPQILSIRHQSIDKLSLCERGCHTVILRLCSALTASLPGIGMSLHTVVDLCGQCYSLVDGTLIAGLQIFIDGRFHISIHRRTVGRQQI